MKSAEQIRAEMDAEPGGPRDWEAEGSSGWESVVELVRRARADAAADMRERAAAKAAMFVNAESYPCEYGETHVFGEDVASAIRSLPTE